MIQGIGNSNLFNAYNRIQYPARQEEIAGGLNGRTLDNAVSAQNEPAKAEPVKMDLKLDAIRPRTNASLEDVSLSLNKSAGFNAKPMSSDIKSLDMDKAVSDMQKDGALMQYQYFVGNDAPVFASEDGTVIAKG